jgi:hypothetical protein
MAIKKWRWLDISEKHTTLELLIRLINQRLRQLASFIEGLSGSGPGQIAWYFYNDGAVLIAGESDWGYIDKACTITGAQIVVAPAGTVTIQVHTSKYPLWDGWTLISGGGPIVLSAQDKAQPSVALWTVAVEAGTYMKVVVVGSVGFIRKATLTLTLEPTG